MSHKGTTVWLLWGLSLLACPVAMVILGAVYYQPPSSESFTKPLLWPWYAVQGLFWCHIGLSVMAAVAALWLVSGWPRLLIAWLVVVVMIGITAWVTLGASMAVSGRYL